MKIIEYDLQESDYDHFKCDGYNHEANIITEVMNNFELVKVTNCITPRDELRIDFDYVSKNGKHMKIYAEGNWSCYEDRDSGWRDVSDVIDNLTLDDLHVDFKNSDYVFNVMFTEYANVIITQVDGSEISRAYRIENAERIFKDVHDAVTSDDWFTLPLNPGTKASEIWINPTHVINIRLVYDNLRCKMIKNYGKE